uniref:ATPase AAA-type core domain-containing protein n=1 Tax=Scylla olivacea TaxID=85551 RepID=A0A0P4WMC8_SCYOL
MPAGVINTLTSHIVYSFLELLSPSPPHHHAHDLVTLTMTLTTSVLLQVLFEMARFHAPSTIFVDEVDALMASRQGEQEHEASRRMKTQLLVELDGLTQSNHHVFLLAASNIPW